MDPESVDEHCHHRNKRLERRSLYLRTTLGLVHMACMRCSENANLPNRRILLCSCNQTAAPAQLIPSLRRVISVKMSRLGIPCKNRKQWVPNTQKKLKTPTSSIL